jgi:hypothetical protein
VLAPVLGGDDLSRLEGFADVAGQVPESLARDAVGLARVGRDACFEDVVDGDAAAAAEERVEPSREGCAQVVGPVRGTRA